MEFAKKRKFDTDDAVYEAPSPLDNAVLEAPSPHYNASLTEEDARNLLRPLTADQLIGILQSAVVRHPDVLESVRLHTDKDPALRKLFVRGLAGETTSESLRRLFSAFGDLDEATVIHDKSTGKSKGFGFVTFKHADAAVLALREPSKKLDGRVTVAQFAAVGSSGPFNNAAADVSSRKIYVGGVPFEISSERLLSIFSAFGEIEEGPLGFDKTTGKPKGFAFFVYKTEDGARAALIEPLKNIDGHQVACKFAVDKKKAKPGGPQPTPVYNSGPNPYMYVQGRNPPVPNSLATRYNPNFGGLNYAPPPSRFPPPPPSSIGVGYSDGPNYGLGVSMGLPSQHQQQPPPGPTSPPGGMYQGMPPYY